MFYSIRHMTRFRYSKPVSESQMEVRMHPRTEGSQRCLTFQLSVSPRARVFSYRDHLLNTVHHFDVPSYHSRLVVVGEALVDVQPPAQLPYSLPQQAWTDLDRMLEREDYWHMLQPSQYAQPCNSLMELATALKVERRADPLGLLREINTSLYHWFDYEQGGTSVHSPIEHALQTRKGVCQDFAHIMITLVRMLGIPCRYVSGYLHHTAQAQDRSSEGATHAWVEAMLPLGLGWIGFDPTNNLIAGVRHIRTAVGADYADVPPTRGVYKGPARSELTVAVRVEPSDTLPPIDEDIASSEDWTVVPLVEPEPPGALHQHQQQQQQ